MVCLRWYFLLRGSGVNLPFRQSLEITFVGLFTSNFLPTTVGGDIIRLAAASKLTNQPVQIAGSLVMDRLMGILGMVLVSPLGAYQVITQGVLAATQLAAFAGFPFLTKPLHWVKEKVRQVLGQTLNRCSKPGNQTPVILVFSLLSTLGHMGFPIPHHHPVLETGRLSHRLLVGGRPVEPELLHHAHSHFHQWAGGAGTQHHAPVWTDRARGSARRPLDGRHDPRTAGISQHPRRDPILFRVSARILAICNLRLRNRSV